MRWVAGEDWKGEAVAEARGDSWHEACNTAQQ